MKDGLNKFSEFSIHIAKKHGVEIAIIHGFFKKHEYLSSMQDEDTAGYPSIPVCCAFLDFWDEEKIRELIAKLYTLKLI
jgi:hypothetical protein